MQYLLFPVTNTIIKFWHPSCPTLLPVEVADVDKSSWKCEKNMFWNSGSLTNICTFYMGGIVSQLHTWGENTRWPDLVCKNLAFYITKSYQVETVNVSFNLLALNCTILFLNHKMRLSTCIKFIYPLKYVRIIPGKTASIACISRSQ